MPLNTRSTSQEDVANDLSQLVPSKANPVIRGRKRTRQQSSSSSSSSHAAAAAAHQDQDQKNKKDQDIPHDREKKATTSTFQTAEAALAALVSIGFSPSVSTREQTVELMREYMKALGLNQKVSKLKIIHVAGTKGKGSTCAMTESICRALGYSTGLFTSPHLISVRERFRFNGEPIDERLFLHHFQLLWDTFFMSSPRSSSSKSRPPGFFRFLTLLAFHVFLALDVDVLILEVGLGGRLDATNVIEHPVVCGITTLDLDHTHVLGNTLEQIAVEKAGIFKSGIPAFTVDQEDGAMAELWRVAKDRATPLMSIPVYENGTNQNHLKLGIPGQYQHINAALAMALAWTFHRQQMQLRVQVEQNPNSDPNQEFILVPSLDFKSFTRQDSVQRGLETCRWPGRCQSLQALDIHWYLDGAHTLKSLECCAQWFRTTTSYSSLEQGGEIKCLLFYCSFDRDIVSIVQPLLDIEFDHVVFCPVGPSRPLLMNMPTLEVMLGKSAPALASAPASSSPSLEWQHRLQQVWTTLLQNRRRSNTHTSTRPALPHAIVVQPSIEDSIAYFNHIKIRQSNPRSKVEVLVTGSLYLVGGVLKGLNWSRSGRSSGSETEAPAESRGAL